MSGEEWQEPKGSIALLTKGALIRNVAARWREQYPAEQYRGTDKDATAHRLLTECPQTEDAVAAIIGNRSWTRLGCDVCEKDVPAVACLRRPYGVSTNICETCAGEAAALFGGNP